MGAMAIRDYNPVMQRAALFTLLAGPVLLAATLQAQPVGGAMRGGGGRAAIVRGGGRSGAGNRLGANARARNFRGDNRNNGMYYPLYDDLGYGDLWYNEEPPDYDGPSETAPMPVPMMAHGGNSRPVPVHTAGPKIIELPVAEDSAAAKPAQAAMFILKNGRRIEARQYLVTYDHVQLTVNRQQHTIPLARLNIDATLDANHQRGIELRIPAGRSEISLGF
jgi:hypothetical protein